MRIKRIYFRKSIHCVWKVLMILYMQKIVAKNKKAYFDYEILESWEAWIELKWYEVKSVRDGKVNLKWSYISLLWNIPMLKWMHISPLSSIPKSTIDSARDRKIFLHKKSLIYLSSKVKETWKSLIPLEIYFSWSLIKVKVWLAEWRKKYDKKQVLKERSMDKEAKMQMKKIYN